MTTVGYATLGIIPEVKGLKRDLERQTSGDLAAAGRKGGKQFGDSAGREAATGFKSRFSGAMKGFAPLAGLVAGVGVTAFFKDAIDGASGLVEAGTKLQAIYGDAASQVQDFAATAAEDLGQTRLQALDAAATFGTFGKAAQLSGAELASFSTELVSLSTDLASFYNTDVQTAIGAIGSGLRGEAEPLRQFGVLLDDATLRQEALRQGLIKTTKQALTPQQKVLAAHAVILAQTTDAQGDFERTSGGLANQQRKLTAQWTEMKTAVGEELLPAMTSLATTLNDDVLPAMGEAGGIAKDAVTAFASLPTPVLAGAAAFVALRIAAATSLGAAAAGGAAAVGSAMTGLRIRTMLATDAFVAARSASITLTGSLAGVSLGAGRAAASMAALRAGAAGAGAAMATGLGKVSALVGGPWGAAFIAGTAILTKFYAQNQKVKAQIESMKGTFEQQTGEFTAETAKQALQVIGDEWLKYAKDIGISMEDLTKAAVEGGPALDAFKAKYGDILRKDDSIESFTSQIEDANKVVRLSQVAFQATKEGVDGYVAGLEEADRAAERSSSETRNLSGSVDEYQRALQGARGEIRKLMDAERARATAAIQNRRDAIGMRETLRAAYEEARKGKDVLLDGSKAADQNMSALLDLAAQWDEATPAARRAIGGYEGMRTEFIKVARQMGATKTEAEKLANQLLKHPKKITTRFESQGYRERLAELKALAAAAAKVPASVKLGYTSQAENQRNARFASGGMIGGYGSGTSDSNLIWASKGEFMQRKAAVDYYGPAFMRALNNLQVPKLPGYAKGGLIQRAPVPVAAGGGVNIHIGVVQAHDYGDFMSQMTKRVQKAQSDGVRMGGR